MSKRQINILLVSFFVTIVVVFGAGFFIWRVIWPQIRQINVTIGTNRTVVDIHTHLNLDPYIPILVMDGQRMHTTVPLVEYRGGVPFVYLPRSFLWEHFDQFLFWDNSSYSLFVSTHDTVFEFIPGDTRYRIDRGAYASHIIYGFLETPIKRVDGETFLPARLVEGLYPVIVEYQPEYNIVVVTTALPLHAVSRVSSNRAAIRHRPDNRAPIVTNLDRDEEVFLFLGANSTIFGLDLVESDGVLSGVWLPESGFASVRTPQGLLGYIDVNDLADIDLVRPADSLNPEFIQGDTYLSEFRWIDNHVNRPPMWPEGVPIHMTWESIYTMDANNILMQIPLHESLNVISPTWFRLDGENLSMTSLASQAYVDWAHSQDVQVWPMVFDINNAHARAILMNRDARQTVINLIVYHIDAFNLDGINIDFEHLFSMEEGPYKIQFLRELAIHTRPRGVVLSAAVKVPMHWSRFYRRDLIAKTVDFIMLMAYDEHYQTSAVSGPVASLGFVQRGVHDILNGTVYINAGMPFASGVPREQLVMGIPFYNRVWREAVLENQRLAPRNWGMDYTRNFFEARGVVWEWDSVIGSYYGQVTDVIDGETRMFRVWLECERSIGVKMQIYVANELAGVTSWRRDFENSATWEVLARHF